VIVHIDMDAFYANVEIRDNQSLKDIPMAVGSESMLVVYKLNSFYDSFIIIIKKTTIVYI
jgi:nucleotidyltransferase/DNA polymerase involved in DNA repair